MGTHKNTWPNHIQGATQMFSWPSGKITITNPCSGKDSKVEFDPLKRPTVSASAPWKEVSQQIMWDFCYLVQELTKRLRDYSASIGTSEEAAKLASFVLYVESPVLSDGTQISVEDMTVEPVFEVIGSQRRIRSVRIEGRFDIGQTTPSGYSSSSSSLNVYP